MGDIPESGLCKVRDCGCWWLKLIFLFCLSRCRIVDGSCIVRF